MVHSVKKSHAFTQVHIQQPVELRDPIPGELNLSKNFKPFISKFVSNIIPPSTTKVAWFCLPLKYRGQ